MAVYTYTHTHIYKESFILFLVRRVVIELEEQDEKQRKQNNEKRAVAKLQFVSLAQPRKRKRNYIRTTNCLTSLNLASQHADTYTSTSAKPTGQSRETESG